MLSNKILCELKNLAKSKNEVCGIINNNEIKILNTGTISSVNIPLNAEKYGVIFHTHPINEFNWVIHSCSDVYESLRRFFNNKQLNYSDLVVTEYGISVISINTSKKIIINNEKVINNITKIAHQNNECIYKNILESLNAIYTDFSFFSETLMYKLNMLLQENIYDIMPNLNVEMYCHKFEI